MRLADFVSKVPVREIGVSAFEHESPVEPAHAAGLETTHVNHLGLSGQPDWAIAKRVAEDGSFIFVTDNRTDFIQLFHGMDLHPQPHCAGSERSAGSTAGSFPRGASVRRSKDLVNTMIEARLEGKTVRCVEYRVTGLAEAPERRHARNAARRAPLWPLITQGAAGTWRR